MADVSDRKTFGVRVNLRLNTGETVEGWLKGETELGVYIATDPQAKFVRFVPQEEYSSVTYHYNSEKAGFRPVNFEEMEEAYYLLRDGLEAPMEKALDRLDFNHLRTLTHRITELQNWLERERIEKGNDEAPLYLALDSRVTHESLLDEITRSGISDILLQREEQIRKIISPSTLPFIDAYYAERDDLDAMIRLAKEKNSLSETNIGKKPLEILTPEVLSSSEGPELEKEGTSEVQKSEKKVQKLRSASAWIKILGGGGLAAVNIGLGVISVCVSSLPTLGLGTVAATVGIATSSYTGLSAASDALKDMASNLEGKYKKK